MRSTQCIAIVLIITTFSYSCSSGVFQRRTRVYQAPALGAETRFQEGLRRQKNPQQLFNKKERRDMEKMGYFSGGGAGRERDAAMEKISPAKADSMLYGIKPDTTQKVIKDSTALPDSIVVPKPDTSAPAR